MKDRESWMHLEVFHDSFRAVDSRRVEAVFYLRSSWSPRLSSLKHAINIMIIILIIIYIFPYLLSIDKKYFFILSLFPIGKVPTYL